MKAPWRVRIIVKLVLSSQKLRANSQQLTANYHIIGTGVPSRELAVQRIAAGDLPMKTFIDMLMKE